MTNPTETTAWRALATHRDRLRDTHLR